jgi:hypothetical protein
MESFEQIVVAGFTENYGIIEKKCLHGAGFFRT